MEEDKQVYRKNFSLIITFIILITVSLIVALVLAYSLTRKYVENEFVSRKIDVLEQTVRPYNDFFQSKVPEVSSYQGFLDSASAVKYVKGIFEGYPFVNRVVFYDTGISNHLISDGLRVRNFAMGPKAAYQFGKHVPRDSVVLFKDDRPKTLSLKTADEFNKVAVKFSAFIESADTTKALNSDDIFNVFYSLTPNRITFMNIPRREEIRLFKDLMFRSEGTLSPVYEQDILTFYLDPLGLKVKNTHPELYNSISIKPLVYESLENEPESIVTEIALPGALADHKLYFSSPNNFLVIEINRRFLPIAGALLLIYGVLILIAYLIFRNLHINARMFRLQYDFITNFTHEFKTPVSVIKIAGNNIRSARELSDTERNLYGKILDEEADKLNDLMNKLLSFTQIENRSIKIKLETVEMDTFCNDIIDAYRLKYPGYDIIYQAIQVKYFKTDPVLLRSLFNNLIDNAYKYSGPDDKELKITVRKRNKNIVFRFTDKGIGIPKSELGNIFRKFYRIQNQYNQQGSVGLGLAFCKELVNFMNGTITVKSRVGEGSEFKIELPYES